MADEPYSQASHSQAAAANGDELYFRTRVYRGSNGVHVKVTYKAGAWWWRHPGGDWHGPFGDMHGTGKMHALVNAAHRWGLSGNAMDWQPADDAKRLFRGDSAVPKRST